MSQTIQISERSAALHAEQAGAHGVSVEVWIERLALEKSHLIGAARHSKTRAAAKGILDLQKHVQPDPERWTVRDYIDCGRR